MGAFTMINSKVKTMKAAFYYYMLFVPFWAKALDLLLIFTVLFLAWKVV